MSETSSILFDRVKTIDFLSVPRRYRPNSEYVRNLHRRVYGLPSTGGRFPQRAPPGARLVTVTLIKELGSTLVNELHPYCSLGLGGGGVVRHSVGVQKGRFAN